MPDGVHRHRNRRIGRTPSVKRGPIVMDRGKRHLAAAIAAAALAAPGPLLEGWQRPPAARGAFDVVEKSIPELRAAMETGAVTSRQLVAAYLARIAAYDQ